MVAAAALAVIAGVSDPGDDDASLFSAGVGGKAAFRWSFGPAAPVPVRTTVYAVCAFVD